MEVMALNNVVVLFVVGIIVQIAERIVSGTWQPFYFRVGIPLFRKSIRLSSPPDLSVEYLEGQFEEGRDVALRFKQISLNEVAFREAFTMFRKFRASFRGPKEGRKSYRSFTHIMHGLIRYDEMTSELHVIGLANWFPPLTIVIIIAIFSSLSLPGDVPPLLGLVFIVFFLALTASAYFIQAKRYTAVLKILSPENTLL